DRVIAPGAWAATSSALLVALIRCQGGFGIRQAGTPLCLDTLGMVCDHLGFLALRARIRPGLLLRELTRMHHDKTERFPRDPSVAVLDFDLAHDTLPMPAAGWLILCAPRLLQHEGQRGLLTPPGFEDLADGTGAGDQRDQIDLMLQTHPSRAATVGLTIGHDPTHPFQA